MKYLKNILAIWGVISLILLVFASGGLYYYSPSGWRNDVQKDVATIKDVRFVLNWVELGDERIKEILHSSESKRSMTGDHNDFYVIKTNDISVEELTNTEMWMRGDKLLGVFESGVELVGMFSNGTTWFPDIDVLTSEEIYVSVWSVRFHRRRATSAKVIFVRPSENKVYYASVKI